MLNLHFVLLVVFVLSTSIKAEELPSAVSASYTPSSDPIVGAGKYYIPPKDWTIGYGYPSGSNDFPSYFERDMLLWANIARIGQKWWRDEFLKPLNSDGTYANIFASGSYPSTYPTYWNLNLNRAARAHSYDIAVNCYSSGGGHNSCNGTDAGTRIYTFTGNGESWFSEIYIHESPGCNITRGFYSIAAWMCDASHDPFCYGGVYGCRQDANAGHRRIIMDWNQEMGCGVVFPKNQKPSDSVSFVSTCDGLKDTRPFYYNLSIVVGSHTMDPYNKKTHFRFYMVYNGSAPSSPELLFDGKSYKMSVAHKGTYGTVYTSESFKISDYTGCKPYYFQAGGQRYPYVDDKVFFTYGIANCTKNAGDAKKGKNGGSLSAGAIAGIVVAVALVAIIVAVILILKFVVKLF